MGEGLERGGKWDFQGGRQWENITQYFAIKKAQRGGSQQKPGTEPGLKGMGRGKFKTPFPSHFLVCCNLARVAVISVSFYTSSYA